MQQCSQLRRPAGAAVARLRVAWKVSPPRSLPPSEAGKGAATTVATAISSAGCQSDRKGVEFAEAGVSSRSGVSSTGVVFVEEEEKEGKRNLFVGWGAGGQETQQLWESRYCFS